MHEDPAQLLAWRERIREFLAERLRLRLTDPSAKPRLIGNGVDFLGYIVQTDYQLVRRWTSTLSTLRPLRLPLCVMRETDESFGAVKTRGVAEYWQQIEADASRRTVMTHAG